MKYAIIALFAITTSCSMQRPTIRDVSNLVDGACVLAQLAPDKTYQGKDVGHWCNLAGVALDAADAIMETVEE